MEKIESTTDTANFVQRINGLNAKQKILSGVTIGLLLFWLFLQFVIISNPSDNVNFRFNFVSIVLNSLLWGSMYLALAVGLTLTYKLLGFPNFAHAELLVVGGFCGIALQRSGILGEGFVLFVGAIIFSFVFTGALAVVCDYLVFRPLRERDSTPQTLMITSLGLSLVLRGVILLIYGNDNQNFSPQIPDFRGRIPNFRIEFTNESFFPQIVPAEFLIIFRNMVAIFFIMAMVIGIYLFLKYTWAGKAMRAVADNSFLAASSGIDVERINRISWFIGGGSAGVAGVFYAQLFIFRAETGSIFLLPAFAVIVLGTVGSIVGVFISAYLLGFVRVVSLPFLSGIGAAYNRPAYASLIDIMPFIILIIVLLFYDKGIGQAIEDRQIEKLKQQELAKLEAEN